ncbi:hypothetical protein KsCSTR_14600 [Candidatus Kuenenia stuttgartiensis]|jgi:hypothetical protein|uniref:Uncharacterized protein n=1 Tax=Kuenenia stuttgartiensis TaxID=174633 RepID=A0A2C9CCR8_KUEST|nr:hypothetical protein KsCSTR_14600 [Candidatus Kuenenia stuttgartiensis]SOH03574.1 hypothetical protein KSMBR1_1071 [Candidatus Kuenenia stuttgartiensis]
MVTQFGMVAILVVLTRLKERFLRWCFQHYFKGEKINVIYWCC